ncbi:MAG: TetR/AcrR family transcriptional regulator, partial [Bacteroidota bacterium]
NNYRTFGKIQKVPYICFMRPQKVQDLEMLKGLMSVLRAKGYDGASLNDLAEAAGLKKASLYHRFPGGKKEMAAAVLNYVEEWIDQNIYRVLTDSELAADERLRITLDNIRALYDQGEAICIFRSMSMETGMELFGQQIKAGLRQWIAAFTQLGVTLGFDPPTAEAKALQTLIDIQGSLVVAKGMNTTAIFETTLQGIHKRYHPTN